MTIPSLVLGYIVIFPIAEIRPQIEVIKLSVGSCTTLKFPVRLHAKPRFNDSESLDNLQDESSVDLVSDPMTS